MFEEKLKYNDFLESLAEALDITESQLNDARSSYRAVGKWLARDESPISNYSPEIYSQGSFRLGTVVKPLANEDDFDVDVVCRLEKLPEDYSQQDLKKAVGDSLIENADYKRMLRRTEGRRCWTLQYADARKFHMDILPSTRDEYQWLVDSGVEEEKARHAIKITDTKSVNYEDSYDKDWPKSNPVGYAEWFFDQMRDQFTEQRRVLAAFRKASVEEIQDFEVKTPLQRAIQILKRHRDVMFGDDDDRPISIIITTLAAKAYSNESTVYDALIRLIQNMPDFIKEDSGVKIVQNPVNPKENFADKWQEYPDRAKNFYAWLEKAEEDLVRIFSQVGLEKAAQNLKGSMGERTVNSALRQIGVEDLVDDGGKLIRRHEGILSVDHRESPAWLMELTGSVSISARYCEFSGWRTLDSSEPLPKRVPIRFIAHTSIETPYDVYWQVVNTGSEASQASNMRGTIFPAKSAGKGGLRNNERSLYTGVHWIECFIVKEGVCIARSGEFLVTIQ